MIRRWLATTAIFALFAAISTGTCRAQAFIPIETDGWRNAAPATSPSAAPLGMGTFAPTQASIIPVVVNDPAVNRSLPTTDPYALVAVRRELPWLGGAIGQTSPNVTLLPPQGNVSLSAGPLRSGWFGGNRRLFSGRLLNGNRRLFNGRLFRGQLFPNVYSAVNKRLWFRTEWLLWDTKGMDVPPLVTTSSAGTTRDLASVLGEANTSVLFGGNQINGGTESGLLFAGGFWVTPQQNFAIEAEYFQLGEQNDRYRIGSDGSGIIGRPFFDVVAGQETAQLVSYPGLVSGSVFVDTESNFRSLMLNGRASMCTTGCNRCGQPDHLDWLIGFRHIQLDDTITVDETLNSLLTTAPGTIAVRDRFRTENEFNGLQLGVVHRANFTRGWLESMLRVALGNNQQTVRIDGTNTITEAGITDTLPGGLLAQRSNSGVHRQDEFTMIPEVGVRLGLRLTSCLSASVGYQVIYFPNVVRAGDQIDTDLNPGLVPPEAIPLTGALRPRFSFIESDYWAHGLTLGGELAF